MPCSCDGFCCIALSSILVIAFLVLVIWSLTDKDPVINPKWFITVTATSLRLLMLAYLVQGLEYFPYIVWWLFGDAGRWYDCSSCRLEGHDV
ncbi:hypothetical protein [Xylella fastidiosa]|uniref:hypothetical protein n=1 Tax=Xylella fastidiosa TaxID=2371 RepID=UPI001F3E9751|nr:hypothetical protein [Xylella fastidiosa]